VLKPTNRACRSNLMIRMVGEVQQARGELDEVLDEVASIDDDVAHAQADNNRLKAAIRRADGEADKCNIQMARLRRQRVLQKASLDAKEAAHKLQLEQLKKELMEEQKAKRAIDAKMRDFKGTVRKLEQERNFYKNKEGPEQATAEQLTAEVARLRENFKRIEATMHDHDEEHDATQRENNFLQKHLETRKAFMGTWYELNIYDLFQTDENPAETELALRHTIHHNDAAIRKVYEKCIRRNKGVNSQSWEKFCRDCQVLSSKVTPEAVGALFHMCVMHDPREDHDGSLLHFNEFVEGMIRVSVLRAPGSTMRVNELFEYFMQNHFKFVAPPSSALDSKAAIPGVFSQVFYTFC